MPLRNGDHGYGGVTKVLHWGTVAAVAAQFAVGYRISDDRDQEPDCDPAAEDHGSLSDAERERLDRIEEACEARADRLDERADEPVGAALDDVGAGDLLDGGLSLPEWHLLLGLTVLLLASLRVLWRSTTPLPPWAPALGPMERRLEALLEKTLLALLFAIPVTGIVLVTGTDDWLPLHVTAHVVFFAALPAHLGLVLRHTVLRRDRQLQRML